MFRILNLWAVLPILVGCSTTGSYKEAETTGPTKLSAVISRAVTHPARPEEDRARDHARRPVDILEFFQIEPGMTVADLMTGRGYYAELLAYSVGETGRVYAQNNAFVVERFANEPLSERLAKPSLKHVIRVDRELDALGFDAAELDVALMVLFYHDTFWQGVDRPKMLAAILDSLKPGGIFGVVDHHAEAGSGGRDVKTLHRVDAKLVAKEVEAAGFFLDEASDVLKNDKDTRTINVFDENIRGKTDRFVYRFRKPTTRP